jgi:AcrR family transcriptional regulator
MATEVKTGDARWVRTRQRLLQGGRKAFASNGVEAATVREIVRAAGVSQPSFYNHFASKDELALAIAAEFFREDRRHKKAVFEQVEDPAEAIAINVGHTLSIATHDPVIAWTLIKSETLRDLVISSKADPLVEMIKAGVRKGRFVANSPNTIALTIRSAAIGLVHAILNGTADDDAPDCFAALVLRMLGLSPDESAEVVASAQRRLAAGLDAAA